MSGSRAEGLGGWHSGPAGKKPPAEDGRWSAWDLARAADRGESPADLARRREESRRFLEALRERVTKALRAP